MEPAAASRSMVCFGVFEVDLRSGELRKNGLRIRLQDQPFQVLVMLLERPGEIVTREEFRKRLWSEDTFVDFDHSLGTAINKIREVLGDSVDSPRFVETLHRRGYRFICPVEPVAPVSPPASAVGAGLMSAQGRPQGAPLRKRWLAALAGAATLGIAALLLALNVAGLRDRLMRHAAPVPKIESIAVLPLENLSHDPEQEYFADGMTEALTTELSKISALKVISRTSAMQYKGAKKPLPQIARELTVDALIRGSVLREGNRVRITVQLLHGPTDRHLWAESYQQEMHGILALQSEVAQAIAREIQAKITPQEQTRLARARSVNPAAHEAYFKGRFYLSKYSEENELKGLEYLRIAVEEDPNFALGHAALSTSYLWTGLESLLPPTTDTYAKAKAEAVKALELDDALSQAHDALAQVKHFYDWDQSGAEREYRRALELDPSNAGTRIAYSYYLCHMGRHEESIAEAKRAREFDPVSLAAIRTVGMAYACARRYDEATEQFRKGLELDPNDHYARFSIARVSIGKGEYDDAVRQIKEQMAVERGIPDANSLTHLGVAYAFAGKKGETTKILAALQAHRVRRHVRPYMIAQLYAALGDRERALGWLERAFEERDIQVVRLKVDITFDSLRSEARFQALLRRVGLPP